jgi:hypothetical protein
MRSINRNLSEIGCPSGEIFYELTFPTMGVEHFVMPEKDSRVDAYSI